MAQEAQAVAEQPTEADKPAGGKGKLVKILIVVASLVAGTAGGLMFIGPLLASDAAAESGEGHGEAEAGGHGGKSKGGHGKEAASSIYSVESLVINPAGTQGTRFLVVSIAVSARDPGVQERLKQRDAEVRDVLVGLLSNHSVDELADLRQREALRESIRTTLETVSGKGTIEKVFLPQFVLQ